MTMMMVKTTNVSTVHRDANQVDDTRTTCLSYQQEDSNGSTLQKMCEAVWDGFTCWNNTEPGHTTYMTCPKGMDVTKQSFRICGISGLWLNKSGFPDHKGWTNYTPCFTKEVLTLFRRLYSGSESEALTKLNIAKQTRALELIGLSMSLAALLLSLLIFYYFRSLRNHRTMIHRQLFIAMVIQVSIRMILYLDQVIVRNSLTHQSEHLYPSNHHHHQNQQEQQQQQLASSSSKGIDNTPILCEAAYICLEYARSSMFMWMFVEGLHLHNMVTAVFEDRMPLFLYPLVGWMFPIPMTLTWAIVTAKYYGSIATTCWWGYSFTSYFWILEGPRLGVLLINLTFLLNILRVLVTKLRQSNTTETEQARKAVKAALVLIPLFGLTNLFNMINAPLERSAFEFGLWSYTTHALTSSQGFILATLYCFCNGEVQLALRKFIRYKVFNRKRSRNSRGGRAQSSLLGTRNPVNGFKPQSFLLVPLPKIEINDDEQPGVA